MKRQYGPLFTTWDSHTRGRWQTRSHVLGLVGGTSRGFPQRLEANRSFPRTLSGGFSFFCNPPTTMATPAETAFAANDAAASAEFHQKKAAEVVAAEEIHGELDKNKILLRTSPLLPRVPGSSPAHDSLSLCWDFFKAFLHAAISWRCVNFQPTPPLLHHS